MRFAVVHEAERFESMRGEWNALAAASTAASPFLTWEWLHTWWKHLGAGRLNIVTVRDEGALVGVVPLVACRARLPFLWRWEFLGTGAVGSDYLDAFVSPGHELRVLEEFADFIRGQNVALRLTNMPADALLARVFAPIHDSGWMAARSEHDACPYIRLGGHTWDSFLATIGPAHRATTRRRLRMLDRKFSMRFEQVRDRSERTRALEALFGFHDSRFGSHATAFHTPALRAFHAEAAARFNEAGWLRLYTLHLDEALAAVMYGFAFGTRFYFYQHGYDPALQPLGVGRAILDMTIRAAIEEGLDEFDLLHGREPYKYAWARDERPLVRVDLFPPDFFGRVHCRTVNAERSLRALARRVITRYVPQAS